MARRHQDEPRFVSQWRWPAGLLHVLHPVSHKKAWNVDHFGRSPQLLSGDHACCGHSKHTTAHTTQAREREAAKAAAARADAPPGPVILLI